MKLILRKTKYRLEHDKQFSVTEIIIVLFLFLAAINFLNKEIYWFFFAFGFLLFVKRSFSVSTKIIPILLFSFVLLLFRRTSQDTLSTMVSTFIYPLAFVIGYCFTAKQKNLERRSYIFLTLTIVLAVGNLLHVLLNVLSSVEFDNRNAIDIWTGTIRAATSQAALCIGTVVVSLATMFVNTTRLKKLLAIIMLGIALWCNLYLAGRTLPIIIVITILVLLLYRLHTAPTEGVRVAVWLVAGVLVVIFAYSLNLFGVREVVLESNLYQRFFGEHAETVVQDGRLERKILYLTHIFDYPFGGNNMKSMFGYAHDLYLDTYDEAGIIALTFILVIDYQSVRTMLKLLKQDGISQYTKMVVLGILICYHLMFMVEPIIAGLEWLLSNYLLLYGSMLSLLRRQNS